MQIKVTSDRVHSLFRDIQVSKEVGVFINKYHYPADYNSVFEKVGYGENNWKRIDECRSLCDALREGDQVECAVFIVETEDRNEADTPAINNRSRDIKDYAEFPLWLYPNADFFKRSEADSRDSLKFRKQWRYTSINREKYKKITGSTLYGYRDKKWVNKNPKITFPILWGIQVKTTVSNLWKRLTGQENLPIISLIANIILAFISIISIAVNIWLLFLKGQ